MEMVFQPVYVITRITLISWGQTHSITAPPIGSAGSLGRSVLNRTSHSTPSTLVVCDVIALGTQRLRGRRILALELCHVLAKNSGGLHQPLSVQGPQILSCRPRRLLEALAMRSCRRQNSSRRQVEQLENEFIRVLGLNTECAGHYRRKVREVDCHDHVGPTTNRRGEDVPVVGIGKLQSWNQVFIPSHYGIDCVFIHQSPRSLKLEAGEVLPLLEQS